MSGGPEIDRCPFCSKEGQEEVYDQKGWYVACHPCGARGPRAQDIAEARRLWNERPDPQRYVLGLLTEEAGEVLQHIGKALRFGLDTKDDQGRSARENLAIESGDLDAAQTIGELAGLWDGEDAATRAQLKTKRLLDPEARDSLGRRLAPDFGRRGTELLAWLEARGE